MHRNPKFNEINDLISSKTMIVNTYISSSIIN